LPATVGPLDAVTVERLGLRLQAPRAWPAPIVLDDQRLVLSPTGSGDTRTTDGPFLYVVVDALELFRTQLNIRGDFDTPVDQLNEVVGALNRNGPRFKSATVYDGANYPGAIVRGYERGNELTIILLRADDGRWLYVGAQAPAPQFAYYDEIFFKPATNALMLAAR
jgi:hypothetical protein